MSEANKNTAPKEKMITIKIPRVSKDQADVPAWVNDRSWTIKRGVEVQVPECVAEVLQHQEEMLEKIMEFEDANASR
jgi:hypothetical protein